ncbi:hypothetical protein Ciccas_008755, partial [Cichlidogyrus casuarinus]
NDFTNLKHHVPSHEAVQEHEEGFDERLHGKIDWSLEVPSFISVGSASEREENFEEKDWQPIASVVWLEALRLRPQLRVTVRVLLSRWRTISQDLPPQFWPRPSAPVDSFEVFIEAWDSVSILTCVEFHQMISNYSGFLQSLFVFLDSGNGHEPGQSIRLAARNGSETSMPNRQDASIDIDSILLKNLLKKLPLLQHLTISGNRVHVTEKGLMNWLRNASITSLVIERNCMKLYENTERVFALVVAKTLNLKRWDFLPAGSIKAKLKSLCYIRN